jgi:hypothetical protein
MSDIILSGELRSDLVHLVAAQARRMEEAAGRADSSGYESYAKIKARLERAAEAMKPQDKALKHYWEEVVSGDGDLQASYLRELETEAMASLGCLAQLTATVCRATWALSPWQERKVGQMSFDELIAEDEEDEPFADLDETAMPEIDEETGEVLDPDEDLAAAPEVLGYDE